MITVKEEVQNQNGMVGSFSNLPGASDVTSMLTP